MIDSGRGETWLPVYIVEMLGPVLFEVKVTNGQRVRHHQDQIRQGTDESVIPVQGTDDGVFTSSGVTLPTTVPDSGMGTERTCSFKFIPLRNGY